MKHIFPMTFVLWLFSFSSLAQGGKIESVYTNLTVKSCKKLKSDANDGIFYSGECRGAGGYKLKVYQTEHHQSLSLIAPTGVESDLDLIENISLAPSSLAGKAEWRVHRVRQKIKPLALVVRVKVFDFPNNREKFKSYLVIAKITPEMACVTDVVEPAVSDQNVKARELADASANKPCRSTAQRSEQIKLTTRELVEQIEKTFENSKNSFTVKRKSKKDGFLTENFSYLLNEKGVSALSVYSQFKGGASEEFYYFKNKQLIYATEEQFFISAGEKNAVWNGVFYFADGQLLDYGTNGHGKSESDDWHPEIEVLKMSRKRLDQMNKYLARKRLQKGGVLQ